MRAPLSLLLVVAACGGTTPSDGKPGTCAAPAKVSLPFTAPTVATTSGLTDTTSLPCSAVQSLAEAVYAFTLSSAKTVHVTANDSSGQGAGFSIRGGTDCSGSSMTCVWESSGVVDEMVALQPGSYVIVVERNPVGKFTLTLE